MRYFPKPLLTIGLMLLVATGVDWDVDLTWYDQHRIEQVGLLCIVALGALTIWRRDLAAFITQLSYRARIALVWAFLWGLVSVATANYPRFAGLEWATLLLLLGLAFSLAAQARLEGAQFDIWAMRLVVALAVMIALKIMVSYLAAMIAVGRLDTVMLFEGTFSNRRFFGQVASLTIPLLAYPLLRGGLSKGTRAVLFAVLALWWMLVIVSGTRGTWMALMVAAIVLAAVGWNACAGWLRIQVLALGVGALSFVALFVWLPNWLGQNVSLEDRLSNFSALNGRAELWASAWVQIQAHPWLGIGPMHLAAIRNDFGAHPHNAVLQLVAEWGTPAALMFMLPVVCGLFFLLAELRQRRAPPSFLVVSLTASLLAISAQSIVDGVIVIPYTQAWLVMVAGWALGIYFRDAAKPCATGLSWMHLGISALSMSAFVLLLYGAFPEILNRVEVTQAYADTGNPLIPRYWGVGWIP